MLEVVAEETAELRPYEDLLADAPSDISQDEKIAQVEARKAAEEQLADAQEKVQNMSPLIEPIK